ncbi:sigma-54 interaction domain-containing protein [Pseudogracilibacillus sp. SO30301A]|uniref:sigma-54 interaction domain-containing protein n=1 Tax=Pseudogracilibacillus sp. SO30301A TaxID=3098291 RepID=UPI00300E0D6C
MSPLELINDKDSPLGKILDYASYEIYVLDKERNIVYVNNKCEKHYGLKATDLLGKNNSIFVQDGYWTPSIVDTVMEKKEPVTILQTTYIGTELLTTGVPIIDHKTNELELVVISAKEVQSFKTVHQQKQLDVPESSGQIEKIVTNNDKMKHLLNMLERVAPVDSTIHIHGETGTGKGIIANRIHQLSPRRDRPMVTINCTAIPESLIESELFGYAPGAFTGAKRSGKIGLIESANKGTVFLDEIGEISMAMQVKLLQVIQEKQFIPVGGNEAVKVDVRFITATNKDLKQLVKEKLFREDLYYRLNVIDLEIPALRERADDIVPLTYYFLNRYNKNYNFDKLISEEALQLITRYAWPGNIRELQNVIERAIVISDTIIQPKDLSHNLQQQIIHDVNLEHHGLDVAIEKLEEKIVLEAYKDHPSTRKLATHLNISQSRASKLIRKYRKG